MITVTLVVTLPDNALERLGEEYADDIDKQTLETYLRNEVADLPVVRWTDGDVLVTAVRGELT